MLKKLRVISILLCGVIFLNGLCICRASAAYTPKPLMVSDEQSIVDKIEDDRHNQNSFKSIINEIDQYYQGKDSDGKSGYSKEFNEYCLSVLFKLYHEILKTDSLQKEFLSPKSKVSKEGIPNIKEVILKGVGVIEGLNDTTNLSYPTLLYRVLNLELDKKRNKSMSQCLDREDKDKNISQHMETILRNGKDLLDLGIFEQADFETLPMVTQLNLLRCVGICGENVGLLLSDEELHKILQEISGLSLEEYQKDLKEMTGPTTSSSSSSFSDENNIKRTKSLEVKILIQFAKIRDVDLKKQISSLEAVIEYFFRLTTPSSSSSSSKPSNDKMYQIAAKYEQGREALIQLGRILQYSGNERIIALRSVINYFGNFQDAANYEQGREALIALGRTSQASDKNDERNKKISALNAVIDYFGGVEKAAKYEQGREALIQLGRILQYSGNERIIALRSVINYFGNFEVAAKDAQGREALIQLGRIPHDYIEEVSALNAVINYFGNFEIAAKDAQGREALIALGRIPHGDVKEQVSALNAAINYFGNFEIAAKDAQGREALIQLGRIPHGDVKEQVSALNAVINYFGNIEVAANYEQGREALLQWCRIPENNNSKKVAILKILKKKNYKLADVCRIANNIFNSLRYEEGDFYYDLRGRLNIILGRSYGFDNSILVGNSTSSSFSPPSSTSLRTNSISPNSFGQSSIKSSYLNPDVISNSPSSVSSNSPSSSSTKFYYQGKRGRNSLSPPPQSHFSLPPSSNSSSPAISTSSSGSSSSDSDQISKVPFSFSDLPNTSKENSKPSSSVPSSTSSSPPPSFSTSSLPSGGIVSNNHSLSLPPSNTSGNSTQGTSHNSLSKNPGKDINSSSPPSSSSSNSKTQEYLKKFIDNLVNEFFKKLNAKYQAKQRKVTAVVEEGIVQKGQTT